MVGRGQDTDAAERARDAAHAGHAVFGDHAEAGAGREVAGAAQACLLRSGYHDDGHDEYQCALVWLSSGIKG